MKRKALVELFECFRVAGVFLFLVYEGTGVLEARSYISCDSFGTMCKKKESEKGHSI